LVNPAAQLEGMTLEGGWKVGPLLPKKIHSTGGNFCQCYKVVSPSGKRAFLKALDFHNAFRLGTEVIEKITVLFNFERDLLGECDRRNMDRVVSAIGSGTAEVDPTNPFGLVPYLIFEEADADIRIHLDDPKNLSSIAWKLRALHHVATGLKQLHSADIAHQDLKPSNVLVFYVNTILTISKVADLGRASRAGSYSPYDEEGWAGDPNYAPPEILYSHIDPDWGKRRLAADLYMLGSLVSFIFTQTTSLATLLHALPLQFWPANWGGIYEDVLPYVQNAFATSSEQFSGAIPEKLRIDLVPVFEQLSNPDPGKRGSPGVLMNKNALERFLSKFDMMAARAEAGKYNT
jgi:serine/threonine protein kinase